MKVHNLVENLLVEYKTLARDLDSLRKLVKELDLLNSAEGEKAKQELYFTTQELPDWIDHLKVCKFSIHNEKLTLDSYL
jgi:hypothetical protein